MSVSSFLKTLAGGFKSPIPINPIRPSGNSILPIIQKTAETVARGSVSPIGPQPKLSSQPIIPTAMANTSLPSFQGTINPNAGTNTTAQRTFSLQSLPQVTANPNIPQITSQTTPQITPVSTSNESSVPTPPPTPTISPEALKAQDLAQKAYEMSLNISPEELSTQEDIDKVQNEIAKANLSFQKGYVDASGQPIPMEFITGQQAQLQRQNALITSSLATQAEPLERKLARMQSTRQSALEASKFALERADNAVASEKSDARYTGEQAESARRFGIETDLSKDKLAEDKRQADLNYKISQQKFEEDKRQFGLKYAQDERQISSALAQKTQAAQETSDAKSQTALGIVNNVNQLLQGDYQGITGGILGRSILTRFGTTNQKEDALFKNIQAQLALGARQLLKGSGAISDYEAKTLQAAASLFGSGDTSTLRNEDFKDAMTQIKGVLMSNNGLEVNVAVTAPNGETKIGPLSRDGIYDAISQGYTVEYK